MAMTKGKSATDSGFSDLRRRLLFVLGAIFIFRAGSFIPVPGLDPVRLHALFSNQQNNIIGMFNMFSGGALMRFSVFALGIMPYISASIVVQLMAVLLPQLSELRKEGEAGQRKLNRYTRLGTLVLAAFQAFGISRMLAAQGIALNPGLPFYFLTSLTLVTGTLFLMWLGEQVTERGIGNGISLLIFAGIVAGIPPALGRTLEQVREGQLPIPVLLLIMLVAAAVFAFVVFVERGQRRITINYARRVQGGSTWSSRSSHLPLKINMAGVIPPIFAASIILFPATLAQWFGHGKGMEWLGMVGVALQRGQVLYTILFAMAIVFFCFFYTALVFNPAETAENLKKSGAFIPGIRPGDQTAHYIDAVMSRLTLWGAIYVSVVCLLPEFMIMLWNVPFTFGGTSLLIIVVVVMDFIAQIQTHIMSYQYESLLRKNGPRAASALTPVR